ncbi:MAG: T9SS type A sorting domain-containing protein [Flavobacteriales bacterium]|nr:T9SS type A sorting domain-containing protein [Flavobacteriales bacterium]
MKKQITFLFLFLFVKLAVSQVNFTELNNKWYVVKSFPNGNSQNPSFLATTTTFYGNTGDTIINNETWIKIGTTQDSILPLLNYTNLGLTKTDQNYILFIEQGTNTIDTLYNFDINIGDSILYNFNTFLPRYLQVDSVDSVLINGLYHKRIFFEREDFPLCCAVEEVWIEGVGSLHGPLFPYYPKTLEIESWDEGNDLSCFEQNGLQTWSHPNYNECFINIVLNIKQNSSNRKTNIYPNPTKGRITIKTEAVFKKTNIKITNIFGKEILNNEFNNTNTVSVNIKNQNRGIYFIHIQTPSETTILKIIKE